ncbi:MAG TPA: hypothetical protein VF899_10290 [Pyrinomonadaceae bacterium]
MFSFKKSTLALSGLSLTISLLFLVNYAAIKMEPANVAAIPSYDFATPIFGLAVAPDGSLLVVRRLKILP